MILSGQKGYVSVFLLLTPTILEQQGGSAPLRTLFNNSSMVQIAQQVFR